MTPLCPVCQQPAHAAEGDDNNVHAACQAAELAASLTKLLDAVPETTRREVLEIVLGDRCRQCLDPDGAWCCYDSGET